MLGCNHSQSVWCQNCINSLITSGSAISACTCHFGIPCYMHSKTLPIPASQEVKETPASQHYNESIDKSVAIVNDLINKLADNEQEPTFRDLIRLLNSVKKLRK